MKNIFKIPLLVLLTLAIFACSTKLPKQTVTINSPLGLYKSNTDQKYWLAIMTESKYLLCSPKNCSQGKYQKIPANYGVILLDFYRTEVGLAIERLSHGKGETDEFYTAINLIRKNSLRANDLAFNIGDCDGIPCVGIGHTRAGVKFYKIDDFDSFWSNSVTHPNFQ